MVCSRPVRVCLVLLFVALLAVTVRVAWISDDAYITLRTVENFVEGRGLRWNSVDRVQINMHPAWTLLLAAGRFVTGECYFTTITIGLVLSAVAAWRLLRMAPSGAVAIVVLLLLVSSRAFTDYATAGLENPLSHLLVLLLFGVVVGEADAARRVARAAVLLGLLACTRMDLLLLALPIAMVGARGVAWRQCVRPACVGALPFLGWLAFATIYHGTPIPIVGYAKAIAHGVPFGDLVVQGGHYVVACARHDPVTMTVLLAGIGVGLLGRAAACRLPAVGVLLYCAYVVKVGGDFMVGRFFTAPFVVAVAMLARALAGAPRGLLVGCGLAAPALLWLGGVPAFCVHPYDEAGPESHHHGVVDERRAYHDSLGLFGRHRTTPLPGIASAGLRANGLGPMIVTWGQVGRYAFEAGDLVHVCDAWLLDPLLMRLPIAVPGVWRVGHFERRLPEGYLESLATGENRIRHPGLRRYYEALRLVVSGPLFAPARWRAMLELWFGTHDEGLRAFVDGEYRQPPRVEVAAAELSPPLPIGSYWYQQPRTRIVYAGGLAVSFAEPVLAARLRVRVLGLTEYRFRLQRDGVVTATVALRPTQRWEFGLQEYVVEVPATAGAFDTVFVDCPPAVDAISCLGGIVPER